MKFIQKKIAYKENGIELFGKEFSKEKIKLIRVCSVIGIILFLFLTQYLPVFLIFVIASILVFMECKTTLNNLSMNAAIDSIGASENHELAGTQHYEDAFIGLMTPNPEYKLSKRELIKKYPKGFSIREYQKATFPVTLKEEPDNPYDPNAIQVLLNGAKIGYIKKGSCAHVKKLIQGEQITKVNATITCGRIKEYDLNDDGDMSYSESSGRSHVKITIHKVA